MNQRRQFIKKGALAGLSLSLAGVDPSGAVAKGSQGEGLRIADKAYRYIEFVLPDDAGELVHNAIRFVRRIVSERTGIDFSVPHTSRIKVLLSVVPQSMPSEAFRITIQSKEAYSIAAGDVQGVIFGLGRFLHNGSLGADGFVPGAWQGFSVPEKPVRMIYFATHFHNFYHDAPIEKVLTYIEELVLWGYNAVNVWFDMHHFEGIDDPAAQGMLDRLAALLKAARDSGMKTMFIVLGNEGYNSTPEALRATTPLQIRLRGKYGVEICPSQPGGAELIVKQVKEEIEAFQKRGIEPDYFGVWPYDQGGCGCSQCTPWGSNGYLRMTRQIAAMVRSKLPDVKIVQSTWLFDVVEDEGEWKGLAKAYQEAKPPVDYILADSHEKFPAYPLNNPVPGNLPLLNFPEISMWESWPWGGFGANPLPARFQTLWNTVRDKVAGGFPYSEGLFEDMNKVMYSHFYWRSDIPATEALRAYISFEFSTLAADKIVEAVKIIERNHGLSTYRGKGWREMPVKITVPTVDHGAAMALKLLTEAERWLTEPVRKGWRWRILYLRAMFDAELRRTAGIPSERAIAGFKELAAIYFAQNADLSVRPPMT
jgi:hypothetical protein